MTESITDLIEKRFAEPVPAGTSRQADGATALILRHRSRRHFKPEPVADGLLRMLFACALSAPQKSDLQQVSIIHLRTAGSGEIARLIPSMPWIAEAPVFLLFCGDGRRIRRICDLRGKPFAHDPLDSFMNAAVDAALAMQNFITAAEAEGLGCCPISAVREIADDIVRIAALPDRVFPLAGLCVGYPSDDPAISVRLPMALTVHVDRYDDSGLEAAIDDYDRRRGERNPLNPLKQRAKDRFGTTDSYGWSEDKTRQVSEAERLGFGDLIGRSFGIRF